MLPYLKVNKLASCFMNIGRRHRLLGRRQALYYSWHNMSISMFAKVPLVPKSQRGDTTGPDEWCTHSRFTSQKRSTELKEYAAFTESNKYTCSLFQVTQPHPSWLATAKPHLRNVLGKEGRGPCILGIPSNTCGSSKNKQIIFTIGNVHYNNNNKTHLLLILSRNYKWLI